MPIPLINGNAYTYAQVVMNILGVPIVGATAINYEENQDVSYNGGQGYYAVNRGKGKITAKGSITLYMEEVEALTKVAPNRRLQNLPLFDITISFLPFDGVVPVTHVIRNVTFLNNKRDMKLDDMKVEVQIDLMASHIDF